MPKRYKLKKKSRSVKENRYIQYDSSDDEIIIIPLLTSTQEEDIDQDYEKKLELYERLLLLIKGQQTNIGNTALLITETNIQLSQPLLDQPFTSLTKQEQLKKVSIAETQIDFYRDRLAQFLESNKNYYDSLADENLQIKNEITTILQNYQTLIITLNETKSKLEQSIIFEKSENAEFNEIQKKIQETNLQIETINNVIKKSKKYIEEQVSKEIKPLITSISKLRKSKKELDNIEVIQKPIIDESNNMLDKLNKIYDANTQLYLDRVNSMILKRSSEIVKNKEFSTIAQKEITDKLQSYVYFILSEAERYLPSEINYLDLFNKFTPKEKNELIVENKKIVEYNIPLLNHENLVTIELQIVETKETKKSTKTKESTDEKVQKYIDKLIKYETSVHDSLIKNNSSLVTEFNNNTISTDKFEENLPKDVDTSFDAMVKKIINIVYVSKIKTLFLPIINAMRSNVDKYFYNRILETINELIRKKKEEKEQEDKLKQSSIENIPIEHIEQFIEEADITKKGYKGGDFFTDIPKYVYNTVDVLLHGVRKDAPPSVREFIKTNKDEHINRIVLYKQPVQSFVTLVGDLVSLGQLNKLVKDLNYDKIVHTFMICHTTSNKYMFIEKNQVANMHLTDLSYVQSLANEPQLEVDMGGRVIKFDQFIDNAKKGLGDNLWLYTPEKYNCQNFIYSLLYYNNILDPNEHEFLVQNAGYIWNGLQKSTQELATGAITLSQLWDVILYGRARRR
jgi:hypothetical protein